MKPAELDTYPVACVEGLIDRVAELEAENKGLAARVAELEARCKLLEEAGDAMASRVPDDHWEARDQAKWRQAKEAKP